LWNTIILKSEPPYCEFTQKLKLIPIEPILVGTTTTLEKVASSGKSFQTIPITHRILKCGPLDGNPSNDEDGDLHMVDLGMMDLPKVLSMFCTLIAM